MQSSQGQIRNSEKILDYCSSLGDLRVPHPLFNTARKNEIPVLYADHILRAAITAMWLGGCIKLDTVVLLVNLIFLNRVVAINRSGF